MLKLLKLVLLYMKITFINKFRQSALLYWFGEPPLKILCIWWHTLAPTCQNNYFNMPTYLFKHVRWIYIVHMQDYFTVQISIIKTFYCVHIDTKVAFQLNSVACWAIYHKCKRHKMFHLNSCNLIRYNNLKEKNLKSFPFRISSQEAHGPYM